ncbi:MAG: transposase [Lachnospiraceae bacterium]|nr:transposase [Lachnospiraceae bacterium]
MTVGQTIRSLRKKRGLTLKELGALCGIDGDKLARYERGEITPRQKTVEKIAGALHVPIVSIQDGMGWTAPQAVEDWEIREYDALLYNGVVASLKEEGSPGVFSPDDAGVQMLLEATKAAIPALIEGMKDMRPEGMVRQEILEELAREVQVEEAPESDEALAERWALTDAQWGELWDLLPSEKTERGRNFKDNRLMLDGILYWMRTGVSWRKLPKRYGRYRSVYDRLRLWNELGVWDAALERLLKLGIIRESEIVVDSQHFREYKKKSNMP